MVGSKHRTKFGSKQTRKGCDEMERQAKDLVSDGFNLTYLELRNPSSISYNLYSTTFGERPSIISMPRYQFLHIYNTCPRIRFFT